MTPHQCCESAEFGLSRVQQELLHPSPNALDESLQTLIEAAESLRALGAGGSGELDDSVRQALQRVQTSARNLRIQIDHGSNLVRGWMQLKFGSGYARNGSPEFAPPVAGQSLEA